ncbi:hypothetical protein BJ878DRAFT_55693 [Calycina marina]|uniref:Uncharacterized protein n=1 Tax=Calycina marina TaxID=1763456 RepID=A0A9P8CFD8_9HELO|nr:hypothetical protein BJ878DRAFT_55693 [Calycina marina]
MSRLLHICPKLSVVLSILQPLWIARTGRQHSPPAIKSLQVDESFITKQCQLKLIPFYAKVLLRQSSECSKQESALFACPSESACLLELHINTARLTTTVIKSRLLDFVYGRKQNTDFEGLDVPKAWYQLPRRLLPVSSENPTRVLIYPDGIAYTAAKLERPYAAQQPIP